MTCHKCFTEIEENEEHQCELRRRINNLKEYLKLLEQELHG